MVTSCATPLRKGEERTASGGQAEGGPYTSMWLEGLGGGVGAGPGPLEVEATEVAGDVDDFTDEEEAANFRGFHGFAGKSAGIHAASGDFGFFVAFGGCRSDRPGVESIFEGEEIGVGPGIGGVVLQPLSGEAIR